MSPSKMRNFDQKKIFLAVMVLFVAGIVAQDGNLVPGGDGSGIKCTACSACNNPCNQHPPPPPPSPPPPTPTNPSKNYCPPPPPPYIYITGPPGNLYPYDPYYNSATAHGLLQLPVVFACSLLCLFVFLRI